MTQANQITTTTGSKSNNARAMKTTFVTVNALTVVKPSGTRRYYLNGKPVAQSKFQRLQSTRISADCFITTSHRGVFKQQATEKAVTCVATPVGETAATPRPNGFVSGVTVSMAVKQTAL